MLIVWPGATDVALAISERIDAGWLPVPFVPWAPTTWTTTEPELQVFPSVTITWRV